MGAVSGVVLAVRLVLNVLHMLQAECLEYTADTGECDEGGRGSADYPHEKNRCRGEGVVVLAPRALHKSEAHCRDSFSGS